MAEYKREFPLFALCGLNCGLCPRYQTDGSSKCPGCGGPDFHLKHPTCPVVTCNKKHDNVEYCFQCSSYPCKKYSEPKNLDSFITYKNVLSDFERAKKESKQYQEEIKRKVEIAEFLIRNYNDGKRKGFYCLAVNLLGLSDLENIMENLHQEIDTQNQDQNDKIARIVEMLETQAKKRNIELKLRKKQKS